MNDFWSDAWLVLNFILGGLAAGLILFWLWVLLGVKCLLLLGLFAGFLLLAIGMFGAMKP